jgi:ketose-bisphosphate aldolase
MYMPYVEVKDILTHAQKYHYGVAFFSVYDLESVQGVVKAAEIMCSPIVLTPWNDETLARGFGTLENLCEYFCKNAKVPVSYHLDHAANLDVVKESITLGYRSIMIDQARNSSLDDYIEKTKEVVQFCHESICIVEGEIGKTESTWASRGGGKDKFSTCSNPVDVKRYVEETSVDTVAITIGTRSGAYYERPKINLDLIETTKRMVDVPLALHGASGLSNEDLSECYSRGIQYFKFGSNIRNAFFTKLDQIRTQFPKDMLDMRYLLLPAQEEITKVVQNIIRTLNSENMAYKF